MLTAVHIPETPDPVPQSALRVLLPGEVEIAQQQRGFRQVEFVGGRIALRAACGQVGVRAGVLTRTERGAPVLPAGLIGSVSHKRGLAVAMVAQATDGTLGIDLEDYAPERVSIAKKVLTPAELAVVETLPPERRWMGILIRFSIKEAIYKAVDPYVQRYVGFSEAEVTPHLQGLADATLTLANGEGQFSIDARYTWLKGRLLTSVRLHPTTT